MKPPRFLVLPIRLSGFAIFSCSACVSLSQTIYWDGASTSGVWTEVANWSTVAGSVAPEHNPPNVPDASNIVYFSATTSTAARTVTLGAIPDDPDRSVRGIATGLAGSHVINITGGGRRTGGATRTLAIGSDGISHKKGGVTIGSTTAAQEVDVLLNGTQVWDSDTDDGVQAIFVRNNVTLNTSGSQTLTLTGRNTGSNIAGTIADGAGTLNIVKTGVGIWAFEGENTFSGSVTVNSGTLRLNRKNTLVPSTVSVASGATLQIRTGTLLTFTGSEISDLLSGANINSGATLIVEATGPTRISSDITNSYNFTKQGTGDLLLSGNNTSNGAYSVAGGSLSFASIDAIPDASGTRPRPLTLSGSGSAGLAVGSGGFTWEDAWDSLTTLLARTNLSGGIIGISTAIGDYTHSGPLVPDGHTGPLVKVGGNTLTLTGSSSSTSGVTVGAGGILRVFSLPNNTSPSPVGRVLSGTHNLTLSGGSFLFAGDETVTDRMFAFTTSSELNASGRGPIRFNQLGSYPVTGSAARTLTLTGYNKGENRIDGIIPNPAGGNTVSVTKRGSGSWTLSGANTFTGTLRVDSGVLTLDYGTNKASSAGTITLNGGTIVFKAGAVASDTVAKINLTASQSSGSHLKLEGGFSLNVTNLGGATNVQRNDLIDLSGHAGNSLTAAGISEGLTVINGILMGNGATTANGRASIVLRSPDGTYSFPEISGASSGNIQKMSPSKYTELFPGTIAMESLTDHYLLKQEGTYTIPTSSVIPDSRARFSTATFDTSLGDITLNVSNNRLSPTGAGRAFLFSGANNAAITGFIGGPDATGDAPIWFHNYLDEEAFLEISADMASTQHAIFGGNGLTVYNGSGFSANLLLHGGVFRATQQQVTSFNNSPPVFKVSNGAVFELGAKIAPPTIEYYGDFIKTVGNMPGGIRFLGDAGVSAYHGTPGEKRIFNFCNEIPPDIGQGIWIYTYQSQNLMWGTEYFLTVPETANIDGDCTFKLSSKHSNACVEVQNQIDLNGKARTIEVADGSSSIDAQISGKLIGGAAAGIVKTGPGTLLLSGVNDYKGETRVADGVLIGDSTSFHPESSVRVDGTGQLKVSGGVEVATLEVWLEDSGTGDPGDPPPSPVVIVDGASSSITAGEVYINGVRRPPGPVTHPQITGVVNAGGSLTPYQQWVVDRALGEGESDPDHDADDDGVDNVIEYAVGSDPKVPGGSPLAMVPGDPKSFRFNRAAGRTDISLYVEANDTLTGSWSANIVASATGEGAFTSIPGVTVEEAGGVVTVTDTREAGKRFYRLRVELP